MGGRIARAWWVLLGALSLVLVAAPSAAACSPPFGEPTIEALGPAQLVLLGRTGELAPGGRLFHVERAWNGEVPTSPIVIAFKEGEPVGDCSYPVPRGQRLVIAPDMGPDGRLSANLVTLQADPNTDDGRRYLAEAKALYGEGTVPVDTSPDDHPADAASPGALVALAVIGLLAVAGIVVVWRRA